MVLRKCCSMMLCFLKNCQCQRNSELGLLNSFRFRQLHFFSFLDLVGKFAHWTGFLFFILLYTSELPIYKKCQYQRNSELCLFNSFRFHLLFFFFFFFFSFSNLIGKLAYWTRIYLFTFYIHMSHTKKIKYYHKILIQYFHNWWVVNSLLAKIE